MTPRAHLATTARMTRKPVAAFLVTRFGGGDATPYAWVGAVFGVAYLGGLLLVPNPVVAACDRPSGTPALASPDKRDGPKSRRSVHRRHSVAPGCTAVAVKLPCGDRSNVSHSRV